MSNTIFYSDKNIITENKNGFVINFVKDKSDIEDLSDYGFRIGMSPLSAKELLYTLYFAVGQHENNNGPIKVSPDIVQKYTLKTPAPMGFHTDET